MTKFPRFRPRVRRVFLLPCNLNIADSALPARGRGKGGPILRGLSLKCWADPVRNTKVSVMGPRFRGGDSYYFAAAFHSLTSPPKSAASGSRMAEGVREKRGAGAGCVTPWR